MKIVCLGDSNTYGYDPRSYFGGRYPNECHWVDILADRLCGTVINAGENGREVPHRAWELADFQRTLAAEKPIDLLLIMLGTNDLLQGNSVEDVTMRMEAFLRMIDLEPNTIVLIAPPILRPGDWVSSQTLIDASSNLIVAYKELSDGLRVCFVDTGGWNLPLCFDGVHLTQEGHRVMADKLIRCLREGELI